MTDAQVATTKTPPVISAPQAPPLSKEERKQRYEAYRKNAGKSRFEVVGDPSLHYFWAPKDDGSEMTRLDMLGYAIVREPQAELVIAGKAQPKVRAAGLRQDGTYVIGDVILTSCPQELYEFHLQDVEERSDDMLRAAKEDFLLEAEKSGAPTFTFTK